MFEVKDLQKSLQQYDEVITVARTLVLKKSGLYGQSWIICRPFSMLEQAWIKAGRIRTIQEKKGEQEITDEPISDDFFHIINYCIFGLILLTEKPQESFSDEQLKTHYDQKAQIARELFKKKNHDYGEAWRILAISTMVDLSLMKVARAQTMHKNSIDSEEALSEIFRDILNYAVFCRIKINEGENSLL